jgi:hypothetical protein
MRELVEAGQLVPDEVIVQVRMAHRQLGVAGVFDHRMVCQE